jgi:uncharacterized membrane protein
MLPHLFGLTALGSVRPYFRKHVLDTLDPHDFLFLNAFIIAILIGIYFLYTYYFNHSVVKKTFKNCLSLNYTQFGAILVLGVFTIFGTLLLLDADKNYNTPAMNSIMFKSVSMIALFLIGVFIFEEEYSVKQIIGIVLTIAGILVLMS